MKMLSSTFIYLCLLLKNIMSVLEHSIFFRRSGTFAFWGCTNLHHWLEETYGVSFSILDDHNLSNGFYFLLRYGDLSSQFLYHRNRLVDIIDHHIVNDWLIHLPLIHPTHAEGTAHRSNFLCVSGYDILILHRCHLWIHRNLGRFNLPPE